MEARIEGTKRCMSGGCRRGGSKSMQPCNEFIFKAKQRDVTEAPVYQGG